MANGKISPLRFLAGISLLAMAGCSTTSNGVSQPSGPELVQNDKALVMPPPGGPAIVGVVETRRANGVEQTLSLSTSSSVQGQNYLKVIYRGGEGGQANSEAPSSGYRPFSDYDIRREIAAAAPGVRLARSSTFLQNAYGPFGYASGHSRLGDACLYGWQQIRSRNVGSGMGRDFGMIQIKLRICDNRATDRELLSIMYGYTIVGTFQGEIWNPYGSTAPLDPRIGATGQPIYPMPDMTNRNMAFGYSEKPVTYSPPVRRAAPVTRPAVRRAVSPAPAQLPAAAPVMNGPLVPLPDTNVTNAQSISQPYSATSSRNAVRPVAAPIPSPDCIGPGANSSNCGN